MYTSRRRLRDAEFLRVQPGASVFVAAERARGVGRRAFVFFCASSGGEVEFRRVREGVQRGGASGVSPGAAAEGVVVRVRGGDHEFTAAGGADQGGFGAAVFGRRGATGLLGAEGFSEAAEASGEQHVHAGGGVGAEFGDG